MCDSVVVGNLYRFIGNYEESLYKTAYTITSEEYSGSISPFDSIYSNDVILILDMIAYDSSFSDKSSAFDWNFLVLAPDAKIGWLTKRKGIEIGKYMVAL